VNKMKPAIGLVYSSNYAILTKRVMKKAQNSITCKLRKFLTYFKRAPFYLVFLHFMLFIGRQLANDPYHKFNVIL